MHLLYKYLNISKCYAHQKYFKTLLDIETYLIPSKVPMYQILYPFSSLVRQLILHFEGPTS